MQNKTAETRKNATPDSRLYEIPDARIDGTGKLNTSAFFAQVASYPAAAKKFVHS
jgi:hypothetical protein